MILQMLFRYESENSFVLFKIFLEEMCIGNDGIAALPLMIQVLASRCPNNGHITHQQTVLLMFTRIKWI